MSQRFFVPFSIAEPRIVLDGDEGHHLARVMRAQPGDAVTLFDGGGAEFPARIAGVRRASVELDIVERLEVDRELPVAIVLGVALPKGDRQRFLVEKSVELGVARLAPLETERGVAQPTDSALERLRRAVIEASKQCGRNRLMEIASAQPVDEFVRSAPSDALRLISHPGAPGSGVVFGQSVLQTETMPADNDSRPPDVAPPLRPTIFLAVGPEGGFSDDEISKALAAGWRPVDLGPRILRVETAALALAAQISLSFG